MRNFICKCILLAFYIFTCSPSICFSQPYKAVNLGNWLVTEGWMESTLFSTIPNNDLLDGTQVQLMSTKLQKYVAAENGGGTIVVANRSSASDWETFRLWRTNQTFFSLRVSNKAFVGLAGNGGRVVASATDVNNPPIFQIIRNPNDKNRIKLQAPNGKLVQVQSDTLLTADYQGMGWDDGNPSVFTVKIVRTLQGEYQLTNGLGPERAPQVLQEHWNKYITEDDFSFLSSNGINAVRIPVGWWIRYDRTPPKPFVGGSLQALDNAFTWAQAHGMKVIVDLHAVQGSQNGNDHSASRDGFQEWGDAYIPDTVAVIDFLANRYANRPSLTAIELINEPTAPGVTLDVLKKYYQQGYDTVRKYSQTAYVILSNRLGPADPKELLSFAGGLKNVVIDVHYYNLFSNMFDGKSVQWNINYIRNNRASDLSTVTTNSALSFVGEWTGEWAVRGASMQDYQNFVKAQQEVYGRATFGWAYWSYRRELDPNAKNIWSLKWMISNGYINVKATN